MNETTILLSGDPKAKPDFLATVEPAIPQQPPFTLPFELVLDGYTREPWSSGNANGQHITHIEWNSCYLVSTDGRNRLPGFMQYLQGRKKAAIAKFDASDALPSSSSDDNKAILVVPYDPPPIPIDKLPQGVDKSQVIYVKYLKDANILKGGNLASNTKKIEEKKKIEEQKLMQKKIEQQQAQKKIQPPAPRTISTSTKKASGLLGNLLGAQRRTENHLDLVRAQKNSEVAFDPNTGAAGCINAFRTKISTELEQFKADPTKFTTKVSISLASLIKSVPVDEQDKVTMDVFKFTVYEQVSYIKHVLHVFIFIEYQSCIHLSRISL